MTRTAALDSLEWFDPLSDPAAVVRPGSPAMLVLTLLFAFATADADQLPPPASRRVDYVRDVQLA
jgi:hypothetical protein